MSMIDWKEKQSRRPKWPLVLVVILCTSVIGTGFWLWDRYWIADRMVIPLAEYSSAEYPEDPAEKSLHYGRYSDRTLKLVKRDDTHFDFIIEPKHAHVATVTYKNVDVSLMTPSEPEWTKGDEDLERIALTDRQWNRQQVSFKRNSAHIEVSGGNGFEREHLFSAELAKNCLNAGLWEVLLFSHEDEKKSLYYQGWFTFPLGHYKNIFEHNTRTSYLKHWYKLEHWSDPEGTRLDLSQLRTVLSEKEVKSEFIKDELIFAFGEQRRKLNSFNTHNLLSWQDYFKEQASEIYFATFAPPGRYFVSKPWKNEYWRLSKFNKAILRNIKPPGSEKTLQEVELVFIDGKSQEPTRFLVSGIDAQNLPQMEIADYHQSFYMPMGIGVPPFFQDYEELKRNPPDKSPYFSVMLDKDNRWINHHDVAIDGPIVHRDIVNPDLLHLYLLSYERHSLIGHFVVGLSDETSLAHRDTSMEQKQYKL